MVTKEPVKDGGGMKFTKPAGQIKPPYEGRDEEEELQQALPARGEIAPEEKVMRAGKVPLHPAVIRLPFSIFGRIGTELTGYEGFSFTEMELNDLAELWVQCGVEMSPLLQASIGTTAMVGGKSLGYFAWIKAGKPKLHKPGESYEKEKKEEE